MFKCYKTFCPECEFFDFCPGPSQEWPILVLDDFPSPKITEIKDGE